MTASPLGVLLVDKPSGITSHDVVARVRRLLGTRRVGHGGTLDPMATGLLVLGVGQATRLLRWVSDGEKSYEAMVRLGIATSTDDADGEVTATATPGRLRDIGEDTIGAAVERFIGSISQVPSSVSAIKVDGVRAYTRARAGEDFELTAREVMIRELTWTLAERAEEHIDVAIRVRCSSGTYVRALARDIGSSLGVGGHLVALRRTRVNGFTIEEAHALDDLTPECLQPMDDAVRRILPTAVVEASLVSSVLHGRPIPWPGESPESHALVTDSGKLMAVAHEVSGITRYDCVFA